MTFDREIENKEKFLRALKKRVNENPFARFGLGPKGLCGKVRDNKILLYRGGRGVATLLGTTLIASVSGNRMRIRFGRSRLVFFFWLLWCALLFAAGVSLLFGEAFGEAYLPVSDLIFALLLLVFSVALSLPAFFPSKKEKQRLLEALLG